MNEERPGALWPHDQLFDLFATKHGPITEQFAQAQADVRKTATAYVRPGANALRAKKKRQRQNRRGGNR